MDEVNPVGKFTAGRDQETVAAGVPRFLGGCLPPGDQVAR